MDNFKIKKQANFKRTLNIIAEAESILDECFSHQDELLNQPKHIKDEALKDVWAAFNRRLEKLEGKKDS